MLANCYVINIIKNVFFLIIIIIKINIFFFWCVNVLCDDIDDDERDFRV